MIKRILMLVLALTMVFAIAACSTPPTECTAHVDENADGKCDVCEAVVEPQEKPEEKPAEQLVLIEDGKAKFQIVTATTFVSNANTKKALDTLSKKLKNLDLDVDIVAENASNAKDCEVIIGAPTTRGDAYAYDEHSLGSKGYLIKLIDGKILIIGGSEQSLLEAIEEFTEKFLGIDDKTKKLENVTVKSTQNVEKIQDDYRVTAIKLNGEDMKGYTIAADTTNSMVKAAAENIQSTLYIKTGYWLDIVKLDKADKSIVIKIKPNTYEGNGYSVKVDGTQLVFETEFPNKIEEKVTQFLATNITVKTGEVDFTQKINKSENVRTIYYSEFKDKIPEKYKNDATIDDFRLMQTTHDYANQWGHDVSADKNATYTIKKGRHNENIVIKTNTNWKGATIVVDDSELLPVSKNGYDTDIFSIESDTKQIKFATDDIPISTLTKDATTIGFAPGFKAMVKIFNSNVKHYIRYGGNADDGQSQCDVLLVDADGTILEDTGVLFDYEAITSMYYWSVEDRPIEIIGCTFKTRHNRAPSEYTYYGRGIYLGRSNTYIHGFDHDYIDEGDTGAPYSGFLVSRDNYNSVIADCDLDEPKSFRTMGSGGSEVGMGSYAFTGKYLINMTWKGLTLKTFYDEKKINYAANGGQMGTNFCKNIYFIDNQLTSFDAHCGAKNIYIKGCELEHINCIGGGEVILEDTVVFTEYKGSAIVLRQDYGAIWMGTVTFRNVELRTYERKDVALIYAPYTPDHNFGYKTTMPHTVIVDNVWATSATGFKVDSVALTVKDPASYGQDIRYNAKNPYGITENFIIESNPKNTVFNLYKTSAAHRDIKVTDKTGNTIVK